VWSAVFCGCLASDGFNLEFNWRWLLTTLLSRNSSQGWYSHLLREIEPDEIQLNAPSRPIPLAWCLDARGNNDSYRVPAIRPRTIQPEEVARIGTTLYYLTGLKIIFDHGSTNAHEGIIFECNKQGKV
jgi:hypothetical protein